MNSFRRINLFLSAIMLSLLSLLSCSEGETVTERRSVYYWNTTFRIDSIKRDFLLRHHIDRIYVRYFDVVAGADGEPMPNATIRFDGAHDSLEWEVVPVVFILPEALDCRRDHLAEKILDRVKQMSETHAMGPVEELQIDCDWTASTRSQFYEFMDCLKKLTSEQGITLSSTIRLHQLSADPPPSDRGVLMVYNTGDLRDIDKEKPILDPEDVEPYLKHLKSYRLPLSTAYPIYRWDLLFRNGRFVDIVHDSDDVPVLPSDSLVVREPSAADILISRSVIEKIRPECGKEIILFDLNNFNINRYDEATIESFYH